MPHMGKYCKAYLLRQFREFPGWSERKENVRCVREMVEGKEIDVREELTDVSILYLQENYVVTDGIFIDEYIIFDNVTDEWKEFCADELHFRIPDFEASEPPVQNGDEPA